MKKKNEQLAYSRALVPKKGRRYLIMTMCVLIIAIIIVMILFK